MRRRRRCLLDDLVKILTDSKSIYVESGYQRCLVGLSFCPKAAPSGTCKEAGEESAKFFLHPPLSLASGIILCVVENAPLMNHPNRAGMYQCLLIVNLTFMIFNHASLHLPNSPFSSCLVPRTPYFPLLLGPGNG